MKLLKHLQEETLEAIRGIPPSGGWDDVKILRSDIVLYLSGIHALNLPCALLTCGDWHTSGINWNSFVLLESEKSIFRDYGIEQNKIIPENTGTFNVANHIRALLDLLAEGKYGIAQWWNNILNYLLFYT